MLCPPHNVQELLLSQKIANGAFGDLYKGLYFGQDVAVKILRDVDSNSHQYNEFMQEVTIMKKIRHKNIVQFIGACTVRPNLCLVFEYMNNGSLYDVIRNGGALAASTVVKIALCVSRGMNYLHQRKIIHRDLKVCDMSASFGLQGIINPPCPGLLWVTNSSISFVGLTLCVTNSLCGILQAANILMDTGGVVKIADFGVARVLTDSSGNMTAETGTYRWMAPEVIEHRPYDNKADVFSFGIVLWELLTGKVPYPGLSPLQAAIAVVQKGLRPPIQVSAYPKSSSLCNQHD